MSKTIEISVGVELFTRIINRICGEYDKIINSNKNEISELKLENERLRTIIRNDYNLNRVHPSVRLLHKEVIKNAKMPIS